VQAISRPAYLVAYFARYAGLFPGTRGLLRPQYSSGKQSDLGGWGARQGVRL